jgi:hypothetical protein
MTLGSCKANSEGCYKECKREFSESDHHDCRRTRRLCRSSGISDEDCIDIDYIKRI